MAIKHSVLASMICILLGFLAHGVCGCKDGPAVGTERGPCYPNGTCNGGLVCLSGLCVDLGHSDAGADSGQRDGAVGDGAVGDGTVGDGAIADGAPNDAVSSDAGVADADLCHEATIDRSNVGCEFIAADMGNIDEGGANDQSCFAVLVYNVQTVKDATITMEDKTGNVLNFPGHGSHRVVPAGMMEVFVVTGANGSCFAGDPATPNATLMASGLQVGGAFRLRSSQPVAAFQINPYEGASAHSTDAALLIPVNTLGSQYLVASYAGLAQAGSEISIVAVDDNTLVVVDPSVPLQAGAPVPAAGSFSVTLDALDHLQIVAEGTADLSGTQVIATRAGMPAPVAVFAGAGCAQVPLGYTWCDHLEEQLPPVRTWGWTYIAAPPARRASEDTLWRFVAAVDGTAVWFEPSWISPTNPITLNRGEFHTLEASYPFKARSDQSHPFLLMNLMKGAQAAAQDSGVAVESLGDLRGDPSTTLSVPVEQYRASYGFVSDPTYAYNFLVVARTSPTSVIRLDCFDPIPAHRFTTVSGDLAVATIVLSSADPLLKQPDGLCQGWGNAHRVWGTDPFGIWVYGYHMDVSYGYPGGMSLEEVNSVVLPP